ncbi:MAG TPA: ABC transporter ATP-binding protein [Mycobacteriales bacterium]|nr:ABC transporter ATP-binding protein [Mycobacteriales bacterium]
MSNDAPESRPHPDVVVSVQDVTVSRNGTHLLSGLQWQVELDERWVVLGPNGAGKTTLLSLASARMHPTTGTVHLLGERLGAVDVFELRPRIGLSTALLAERIPPDETVHDVVVTAAYAVVGRFREAYEVMDEIRARALLDQLGVVHLANRRYGTLSEGERKRVQIARALMTDPELLLLDEPAAGLDLGGREDLVRRLGELAEDPAAPTLVLVTHHVEEIPPGFTHALLLRDGRTVAQGLTADVLTDDNLSQTFGIPLRVERYGGRYFARAVGSPPV